MTARVLFASMCTAALLLSPAVGHAQQPPPTPIPPQAPTAPKPPLPPAPPPAPPRREGQPINVKVELTILDQRGSGAPMKKNVSVVVADNMSGFIRTQSFYTVSGRPEPVPLNVDVDPQILSDGKIRLRIGVQYDLPASLANAAEGGDRSQGNLFTTTLRENLAIIVESGKSIVAAQSADPVGDRQVTLELKATILR
jgi:hypothetical protein